MKGFEVTFNGKTTAVAKNKHLIMSVIIEKVGAGLRYSFSGTDWDKCLSQTWDYAEELKLGDEFIIRKKEIDKSSEPIHVGSIEPPLAKEKALRMQLKRYRELESKLKEKGLI
ncbi:MAG: hypothetical protein LBG96_06740 [Tannerella sp.]|jgi:hypothetical protein|nr:hypothetical protein [Tannerella sp.]